MAHCSFDIETNGTEDPFVTCASTRLEVPGRPPHTVLWHSSFGTQMNPASLAAMVEYLYALHVTGTPIVTFNGAGFDFRVVHDQLAAGKEPEAARLAVTLALEHLDIMFQFTCEKGYYASMQSFLDGMGHTGKSMSGLEAIELWTGSSATLTTKRVVLDYCARDVECLSDLRNAIIETGGCHRVAKTSKRRTMWTVPTLHSVQDALLRREMRPPDTTWMDNPPDPHTMIGWCNLK